MRVSIGLAFHNCELTLSDAIRSVFAQSFHDWELIMVDDGSSDGSLAIAQAVQDPRVRLVADGHNRGLPYRLNQIARIARGEYLARMDADDLMHPERLALQVRRMDANPRADVIDVGAYSIDAGGCVRGVRHLSAIDTRPLSVLRGTLMLHGALLARTQWFREHPYNEALRRAQDHELWCRTCGSATFARVHEPLYYVREQGACTVKKYLASCRTNRRIFRSYGPPMVGWHRTIALVTESHVKSVMFCLCAALGVESMLIRRRYRPPSGVEMARALQGLAAIRATSVLGLPDDHLGA